MTSKSLCISFVLSISVAGVVNAGTGSCDSKRSWQRQVVKGTIHRWVRSSARPSDLLELVQAEQGIVACASNGREPLRLHTTRLPRGLQVDQLGAILLANELEWADLVPRPEEGLAGKWFQTMPTSVSKGAAQ